MKVRAYAKINLSLDVMGKREDGYHLLKMVMQQVDLYDVININKAKSGIAITCDKFYIPCDSRNLVYKAAEIFLKEYKINSGVTIDIQKNIPVAAGLAGGSVDAAVVLKAMRDIFKIDVTDEELMELGVTIGADIPYCIQGGTALCEGIGEDITPLEPFKNTIVLLVKPNFGISTKDVYRALDVSKIYKRTNTKNLISAMERNDLEQIGLEMRNNLENITLGKHVVLRDIKNKMVSMGAVGSMMSGSGPTVFGIFEDMLTAQRCFEHFSKKYKDVYLTRTI